jgi:hypothetical protein
MLLLVFFSCAKALAHDFENRFVEKISGNALVLNVDKNVPYVDRNAVSAEKKVTFVDKNSASVDKRFLEKLFDDFSRA